MKQIFRKLLILLDKKQKRTMVWLIVMMAIGAGLETLGVGLITEVAREITSQNQENESQILKLFHRLLDRYEVDNTKFIVLVMATLIAVIVIKNVFLYVLQKATLSFVYTNQFRTSERMLRNYLRRHYEFYLSADTAVVQRSITSDVNNMYALILCILQLLSDSIVVVFVLTYCFWNARAMTAVMTITLGVLLILIKKVLTPIMHKAGKDNQDYYSDLFKWISQTVQGIKEIKISGKESYFVDAYRTCGKGYVDAVQKYSLYNNIPKFLIESVCVVTMMLYLIIQFLMGGSVSDLTGAITALAASALILLPRANRINNQINSIAYFEPFFLGVADNLQDEISGEKVDFTDFEKQVEKLPVKSQIELKDITYAYPNTEKLIFDHASLTVPVGSSVGIVGTTGAGKSTVVDIMLGLLDKKSGAVLADGTDVMTNYRGWLKNVGYIPQMIFMLDDTIRKNVAFGVPDDEIDDNRIWEVLREAQLDQFVKELPQGLDTGIGERGIRLSGGQRQRISIARALYDDP